MPGSTLSTVEKNAGSLVLCTPCVLGEHEDYVSVFQKGKESEISNPEY